MITDGDLWRRLFERFLSYLDELVTTDDSDERDLIEVCHSFEGYDGMFMNTERSNTKSMSGPKSCC